MYFLCNIVIMSENITQHFDGQRGISTKRGNTVMLDKVIAYENRLLQDRKLLNDLIAECSAGNTDAMVRMKIEELQRDIDFMAKQTAMLRNAAQTGYAAQTAAQNAPQMMPNWQAPPQPQPAMTAHGPAPMPQEQGSMRPGPMPQPQPQMQPRQNADLEKTIGKSVMGICASLLIFISLISFAVLILPYLNNTVKMVLMYAVSLAFAVTGILLLGKNKDNKWYLSLAGCGVGALYISLFMSCFYFKAISDMTLYVCIFLWGVVICVLSRLRSGIFLIIGQIGVVMSILLGVCLCGATSDEQKLLFLVIYSVLSESVFYVSHFERKYNQNLINHISWSVSMALLILGVNARYMNGTVPGTVSSVILVVICGILILCSMTILQTEEGKTTAFGVFNSIYLLIAYTAFCRRFEMYFAALIVVTVLLVTLELRIAKAGHVGKMILQCVLFLLVFGTIMQMPWLREHMSVFLFATVCLVYGFFRKDTLYKVAGAGYTVLFVIVPMNCYLHLAWGLCLAACAVWLFGRFRDQYLTWMKMAAYPIFLILLTEDAVRIMRELAVEPIVLRWIIVLAVLAAVNIVMMKVPVLYKSIKTGENEREFLIETGAVQIALMWLAFYCMEAATMMWLHVLAVLLGGVAFMANSYNLLKKYHTTWPGIYVATKIMFFIIETLRSYELPDFTVSLAILIIALVCISLGFLVERKWQQSFKTTRIYGLVLAFVSMIKLILIDIHYGNSLMRTVGFFLSGVLCFAISLIYNMVDKKMKK